jgi:acetolactate synthase I/II/III large subunit
MSKMSTGYFFAKTLEGYGVTHVFIVPAIFNQAMAAMEELPITRVTTHHEMAAAYMAAGLRDAYQTGSPVIAISGGPQPDARYRYFYQVVEDFPMFGPVTKLNAMVERPTRLPDLLRQAFRTATTGTPGPVHLEFPGRLGELVAGEGEFEVLVEEQYTRFPAYRIPPDAGEVERALAMLAKAERPVIVAGGGVTASDARAELVELAEKLGIPVAVTMNGKENIPDDHPLSVGNVGAYGRRPANQVVAEADLVFFAGSRAGGLTTNNWKLPRAGTPTIQLDINGEELGRNYPAAVALLGDARLVLRQMADLARPAPPPARRGRRMRRICCGSGAPSCSRPSTPRRCRSDRSASVGRSPSSCPKTPSWCRIPGMRRSGLGRWSASASAGSAISGAPAPSDGDSPRRWGRSARSRSGWSSALRATGACAITWPSSRRRHGPASTP